MTADIIFSGILKLNLKYGNVKAKFKANTLKSEAIIPYTYPLVNNDIKNTASVNTAGINEFVLKNFSINKLIKKNTANTKIVTNEFTKILCSLFI